MSQVDILTYFPILFWSIISFLFFYFFIFCYIVPQVIACFNVRLFFFKKMCIIIASNFAFCSRVGFFYLYIDLYDVFSFMDDLYVFLYALNIYQICAIYSVQLFIPIYIALSIPLKKKDKRYFNKKKIRHVI